MARWQPDYTPTPEEIAAEAAKIRAEWSAEYRAANWKGDRSVKMSVLREIIWGAELGVNERIVCD